MNHTQGIISLIGALSILLAAACNPIPATPPAPKATDLVAIILFDSQTGYIADIAFVHAGTTYECPAEYECITASYDLVHNKTIDTITNDVREISRKSHPIAPKIDG